MGRFKEVVTEQRETERLAQKEKPAREMPKAGQYTFKDLDTPRSRRTVFKR